jgi:hypothetical protein
MTSAKVSFLRSKHAPTCEQYQTFGAYWAERWWTPQTGYQHITTAEAVAELLDEGQARAKMATWGEGRSLSVTSPDTHSTTLHEPGIKWQRLAEALKGQGDRIPTRKVKHADPRKQAG